METDSRQIDHGGEEQDAEKAGAEQDGAEEESERAASGREQSAPGYRHARKDRRIEGIGEKQIPLEHGEKPHGDEGIGHVEKVVAALRPERRFALRQMVDGKEVKREYHSGQGHGVGDLCDAHSGFFRAAQRLAAEEPVQKVAHQYLERTEAACLPLQVRLHHHGKDYGVAAAATEHALPPSPAPMPAPSRGCRAAAQAPRTHPQGSRAASTVSVATEERRRVWRLRRSR
jgi:hypothetical protein